MNYYILDGKTPIHCGDVIKWGEWLGKADRKVNKEEFDGGYVSTVFLGIEHGFDNGAPLLFETMIFGGEHDQFQRRYSTWEQAEEGHKIACELANPTSHRKLQQFKDY